MCFHPSLFDDFANRKVMQKSVFLCVKFTEFYASKEYFHRSISKHATNSNVQVRSAEFGFGFGPQSSGSVLSSVIFSFFIKGNGSKLKQSVSRLIIKALHTAKKMSRVMTD